MKSYVFATTAADFRPDGNVLSSEVRREPSEAGGAEERRAAFSEVALHSATAPAAELEPIPPVVDHEHDLAAIQGGRRVGRDREEATVPVEVGARGEHGGAAAVDERHAGAGRWSRRSRTAARSTSRVMRRTGEASATVGA
jgi:hypothetical protein